MYFHRIPAFAITSHGFAIIFNFIITTAVANVPKMGDPVPACTITGQAHPPSLPNDKHCTEGFGFTNSGFSKSLWNWVWSCNSPLIHTVKSFQISPGHKLETLVSQFKRYIYIAFIYYNIYVYTIWRDYSRSIIIWRNEEFIDKILW